MQATKFVESYFDAWNSRDPKAVADHLAADGVYFDIPQNVRRSHDELLDSLAEFFANNKHRYEPVGDILVGKGSIAFEYRVITQGNPVCDGQAGTSCGAEFISLCGDSAAKITDYYEFPFTPNSDSPVRNTARHSAVEKYAKSGLTIAQIEDIKCRLRKLMHSDKVFLRPDLTLPVLARAADCSVNHLSQVINSGFGVSFFDFLNRHRIDYAKSLLGDFAGKNNAILNIAFASGFNSNSAFYSAFRKCVGQTPAQYRRSLAARSH